MAIYRCKSCGGELNVQEGGTIIACDYCGIKQTVPTIEDESIQRLYNRANILRVRGDLIRPKNFTKKYYRQMKKRLRHTGGLFFANME